MIELRPALAAGLALLLQAGCTQHFERVVLLPTGDGSASAVTFATRQDSEKKTALSKPYEVLDIGYDAAQAGTTTEAEVRQRYGRIVPPPPAPPTPPPPKTVAASPPQPTQITLYFLVGKTDFTPESRALFDTVKSRLAASPRATVTVTGHTDRVGSQKRNDALSLRRAQLVRDRLVADGVPRDRIQVIGRGEREPLVQTADEVAEPKNRRVVISIN